MERRKFIRGAALLTACAAAGGAGILAGAAGAAESADSKEEQQQKENTTMAAAPKCKITVLKREYYQDLAEQYLANPKAGKCDLFHDGQEFIVDGEGFWKMMHGNFCSEAWDCVSRYVYAALQGGSIMRGWTNDEKMMITCCNDGVRPVIFKLERIDG